MVVWLVGCVLQADGVTPLLVAIENSHVEAVRALLGAGALRRRKMAVKKDAMVVA